MRARGIIGIGLLAAILLTGAALLSGREEDIEWPE